MRSGVLGLRVDVDTTVGIKKGMPRLLELFESMGIRSTFFIPFGPDHAGYAMRRVFRKDFLSKTFRINPLKIYGFRTLVSGILLPGREIGSGFGDTITTALDKSFEIGLHGWDHFSWQNRIGEMTAEDVSVDLDAATSMFHRVTGVKPHASAAPGWMATENSLDAQEKYNLLYASDLRGWSPFFPVTDSKVLKTLQVPVTLPTLDECLGVNCATTKQYNELILSYFETNQVHVHTVHAELEGGKFLEDFRSLLNELQKKEVRIMPLGRIAGSVNPDKIPLCRIEQRVLPGRSGRITFQGDEVEKPALLELQKPT